MTDILDDNEIRRLHTQGRRAHQAMAKSRQNRIKIIRDFVGAMYGEAGTDLPQPVNIMKQALTTFARQTSPKNVRTLVSTENPSYKLAADDLALELGKVCQDIDFDEAVYRCVLDALMSIGIMKVGIGQDEEVGEEGQSYSSGKIFLSPVDLDDFFYDTKEKTFQSASFMGNIYSVPLEDVQNDPKNDPETVALLQPVPRTNQSLDGGEKASAILFNQDSGGTDSFIDYTELWDYWIPRKKVLVTLTRDGKKLKEVQWEGPKRGPYRILSLGEVPGNAMPTTMAQDLFAINEAQNCMARKVICDELARKMILAVRKGSDGDGDAITNSANLDAIGLNDPKNVQEMRMGGSDSNAVGILIQLQNKAKEVAGNLDSVAGLAPQAPTLGQDQLIKQSSSEAVEEISGRVTKFCSLLLEDVAFWQFTDPTVKMSLTKVVGGTGIPIQIDITPETRRGTFSDYTFKIDPYSLQPQTPAAKLQAIGMTVQQYILPLMPMMQQQGVTLDVKALLQLVGRYANISNEVGEILKVAPPMPMPPPGQDQGGPTMAPNTTRTNVRVNKSGNGGQTKDNELAKNLLMQGNKEPQAG